MKLEFEVTYEDGTQVNGSLASGATTLGSHYRPNLSFACTDFLREDTYLSLGLMGLEDGPISLLF